MFEIGYYERKSFGVRAVQVTEENIAEAAEWCNGAVKTGIRRENGVNVPYNYIELRILVNKTTQLGKAQVGNWITHNKSWKVYEDAMFQWVFQPTDQMRFVKIRALVAEAMTKQDGADEITKRIMDL